MFNPSCFVEVRASLSWFHEDRFAPFDYWWSMPEMGLLTASRYDRILHVLNNIGSSMFLPIRFVNRNHYVRVKLEGGYPVPTISSQWLWWRYPCAIGWATPYQA
ncbi:hypothetical protein OSB04_016828 [Centaurea solstitialis]|uniref:Uncharacterized protein n=1 Tax=Centaurea solstitialis TaxID=347529 RepID=A0AA38T9D8_9ASTR|nr:hypothetical protein OSB04_016828 [Centaurea solstitialis]